MTSFFYIYCQNLSEAKDSSQGHLSAMSAWHDKLHRVKSNTEVTQLLEEDVLEKRRYYVTSIIDVIKFLVENELALRGTWNILDNTEDGNITNLFLLLLSKDQKLKQCHGIIPNYAKYTSPTIQNELIAIIAKVLREKLVKDVNSSSFFTLNVDGTKDKMQREVVSIAVRYIKNGIPTETVLGFETCEDLDAKSLSNLVLESLARYGVDVSKMICQCYDGAELVQNKNKIIGDL